MRGRGGAATHRRPRRAPQHPATALERGNERRETAISGEKRPTLFQFRVLRGTAFRPRCPSTKGRCLCLPRCSSRERDNAFSLRSRRPSYQKAKKRPKKAKKRLCVRCSAAGGRPRQTLTTDATITFRSITSTEIPNPSAVTGSWTTMSGSGRPQGRGHCLSHEGSGNARQRRRLTESSRRRGCGLGRGSCSTASKMNQSLAGWQRKRKERRRLSEVPCSTTRKGMAAESARKGGASRREPGVAGGDGGFGAGEAGGGGAGGGSTMIGLTKDLMEDRASAL